MHSSDQSALQVERIQAIGFTVTNADRSVDFYTKALGFEIISDITEGQTDGLEKRSDAKIRSVTLKLGDEQIRLIQHLHAEGKPIPPDSQSNDLWFQHLAIVVSDMDCAYAHLQSFSIESISTSPQTIPPGNKDAAYIQAFKFKDPDRHPLELIWFPPGKGQEKWHKNSDRLFLGIDHTAIAIANTDQSLQFYRDLLGMQVDGGSFNWRETQARMDGLPNAMVKITALRPAQGGLGIELLDYIQPADGRPMPFDLKRDDIAYVQVELIVSDINQAVNQLQQSNLHVVSAGTVQLSDRPSTQGCLIKDPTGHALLLLAESTS
ncbi:MAG: VOC family protein [Scytolyngbya sp. HA4215-MV1]|jgi:catechol 2,3-dioxygenase-like lactoylglutathione lyase family enzyme|nr:VOC family protein [Scytolyngbya sp. HA4215-MV1]